jgi:tetratricopeptide (TPR) repeat protein
VFEEVTKLDPTFALAYAGLAFAYIERFFTYTPAKEWEVKAFAALERALELDPNLAEAHEARGNLLWTKSQGFPHREAIAEYERAIELKPDLTQAYNDLARALWHVGAVNRAYAAFEKALQIDPAFMNAQFRMGMLEVQRGNYEHGLSLLTMVPDQSLVEWAKAWLLMALLYLDRRDEARDLVEGLSEEHASNPSTASTVSIFLAVEGREQEAEERIQYALENGKDFGHFHHIANEVAVACALMGKKELALKYLEEAASDGFPCYSWFERDPFLKNIQDEPRFIKMINDMRKEWGDLETD